MSLSMLRVLLCLPPCLVCQSNQQIKFNDAQIHMVAV